MSLTIYLIEQCEKLAEKTFHAIQPYIPWVARLCLISTFLEDGIRMLLQWDEQRDYLDTLWGSGYVGGTLFVLLNFILEIGGCILVLTRVQLDIGCAFLGSTGIIQLIVHKVFDYFFILRVIAISGGILMLLAESRTDPEILQEGATTFQDNRQRHYLLFVGRICLIAIFVPVLFFEMSSRFEVIQNILFLIQMLLIIVGYKAKLGALVLVAWLMLWNFYTHAWWMQPFGSKRQDFVLYEFFQTFSVIGGLLMVAALGPGKVSIDERKKR